MTDIVLGQLARLTSERDAIHVAIAPVIAGEKLKPGEHVGISDNEYAYKSADKIGIVDPFLKQVLNKGDRFYLLLYQNTVTGMRHQINVLLDGLVHARGEKWLLSAKL